MRKALFAILGLFIVFVMSGCGGSSGSSSSGSSSGGGSQTRALTVYGQVNYDNGSVASFLPIVVSVDENGDGVFEDNENHYLITDAGGMYRYEFQNTTNRAGENSNNGYKIRVSINSDNCLPLEKITKIASDSFYLAQNLNAACGITSGGSGGSFAVVKPQGNEVSAKIKTSDNATDNISITFSKNLSDNTTVALQYVNPVTDPDGFNGRLEGLSTQSGIEGLVSAGMVKVTVLDGQKRAVEPEDDNITITFPLPHNLWKNISDADPTTDKIEVPLWWYDKHQGMWVKYNRFGYLIDENGNYIKNTQLFDIVVNDNYTGKLYVKGSVSHLSSWNCDYPGPLSGITGTISGEAAKVGGVVCTAAAGCNGVKKDGRFNAVYIPGASDKAKDVVEAARKLLDKTKDQINKIKNSSGSGSGGESGSNKGCDDLKSFAQKSYNLSIKVVKKDLRRVILSLKNDQTRKSALFYYKQFSDAAEAGNLNKASSALNRLKELMPYSDVAKKWGGNATAFMAAQDLNDSINVVQGIGDMMSITDEFMTDLSTIKAIKKMGKCADIIYDIKGHLDTQIKNYVFLKTKLNKNATVNDIKSQLMPSVDNFVSLMRNRVVWKCVGALSSVASKPLGKALEKFSTKFKRRFAMINKKMGVGDIAAVASVSANTFNAIYNFYKLTKPQSIAMQNWKTIDDDRAYFVNSTAKLLRHLADKRDVSKECKKQIENALGISSRRAIDIPNSRAEDSDDKILDNIMALDNVTQTETKDLYSSYFANFMDAMYEMYLGAKGEIILQELAGNLKQPDNVTWRDENGNIVQAPENSGISGQTMDLYYYVDGQRFLLKKNVPLPRYRWNNVGGTPALMDVGTFKFNGRVVTVNVRDSYTDEVIKNIYLTFKIDSNQLFGRSIGNDGNIHVIVKNDNKTHTITAWYGGNNIGKTTIEPDATNVILKIADWVTIQNIDKKLISDNDTYEFKLKFGNFLGTHKLIIDRVDNLTVTVKDVHNNIIYSSTKMNPRNPVIDFNIPNKGQYIILFSYYDNGTKKTIKYPYFLYIKGKPTLVVDNITFVSPADLSNFKAGDNITLSVNAYDNTSSVYYRWTSYPLDSVNVKTLETAKYDNKTFTFKPIFSFDNYTIDAKFCVGVRVFNGREESEYKKKCFTINNLEMNPSLQVSSGYSVVDNTTILRGKVNVFLKGAADFGRFGVKKMEILLDNKSIDNVTYGRYWYDNVLDEYFQQQVRKGLHKVNIKLIFADNSTVDQINYIDIPDPRMSCTKVDNSSMHYRCRITGVKSGSFSWTYDYINWDNESYNANYDVMFPYYGSYIVTASGVIDNNSLVLRKTISVYPTMKEERPQDCHAPRCSVQFSLNNFDFSSVSKLEFVPTFNEKINLTSDNLSFSYTYKNAGFYLPYIKITYNDNHTSYLFFDSMFVPAGLEVYLKDNVSSGIAPLTVHFTADVDNASLAKQYCWNFGDGSALYCSDNNTADHTYTEDGSYTAAVYVTDLNNDNFTDTANINVGSNTLTLKLTNGYEPLKDKKIYEFNPSNTFELVDQGITDSNGVFKTHSPAALGVFDGKNKYFINYFTSSGQETLLIPKLLNETVKLTNVDNNTLNIDVRGSNGRQLFLDNLSNINLTIQSDKLFKNDNAGYSYYYLICLKNRSRIIAPISADISCYSVTNPLQQVEIDVSRLQNPLKILKLKTTVKPADEYSIIVYRIVAFKNNISFEVPFFYSSGYDFSGFKFPMDSFDSIAFVYIVKDNADNNLGYVYRSYTSNEFEHVIDNNLSTFNVNLNLEKRLITVAVSGGNYDISEKEPYENERFQLSVVDDRNLYIAYDNSTVNMPVALTIKKLDSSFTGWYEWNITASVNDLPNTISEETLPVLVSDFSYSFDNSSGELTVNYTPGNDADYCNFEAIESEPYVVLDVKGIPADKKEFFLNRFDNGTWFTNIDFIKVECCNGSGTCEGASKYDVDVSVGE